MTLCTKHNNSNDAIIITHGIVKQHLHTQISHITIYIDVRICPEYKSNKHCSYVLVIKLSLVYINAALQIVLVYVVI